MENNYFYFINQLKRVYIADLECIVESDNTIDINFNDILSDETLCNILGIVYPNKNRTLGEKANMLKFYFAAFKTSKEEREAIVTKMDSNPIVRILITNNETLTKVKNHISIKCRKCGGLGKPSTAILNTREWDENGDDKHKTSHIKCLKCSSCGHSWTKNKELEIKYHLYIVSDHALKEEKFIDKFKSMKNAVKQAKELSGSRVWNFKRISKGKWKSPSFIDIGGHFMIEKVSNYVSHNKV